MSSENENRRARTRVPLEMHVHLRLPGNAESVLMSHDWSTNSVFLRSREPLPLGTRVRLEVIAAGHRGGAHSIHLELTGRVVRAVTRDESTKDHPPGMAIVFDQEPEALYAFLEGMIRTPTIVRPGVERSGAPIIFVVGGQGPQRVAVAEAINRMAYDAVEAEHLPAAVELLSQGHLPDAVIAFSDSAEVLDVLPAEMEAQGSGPTLQLGIGLGVSPAGLREPPRVPTLLLPSFWPLDRLPAALRLFIHRRPAQPAVSSLAQPAAPDGGVEIHV